MIVRRCRDRRNNGCGLALRETETDGWEGQPMPTQELFVAFEDDVWAVRLGKYLLNEQATQKDALDVAMAIAREVAKRGVKSRLLVGDIEGNFVEISTIDPARIAANSP